MVEPRSSSIVSILRGETHASTEEIKEFYPTPEASFPDLLLAVGHVVNSKAIGFLRKFRGKLPEDEFISEEYWRAASPFAEETEQFLKEQLELAMATIPVRRSNYPTFGFGIRFWEKPKDNSDEPYHPSRKEIFLNATPYSLSLQRVNMNVLHFVPESESYTNVNEGIRKAIEEYSGLKAFFQAQRTSS